MATGLVWHERYMWHDTRAAGAFMPAGGWVEPDVHVENQTAAIEKCERLVERVPAPVPASASAGT